MDIDPFPMKKAEMWIVGALPLHYTWHRELLQGRRRDAGRHTWEVAMELSSSEVFLDMPGVLLVPKLCLSGGCLHAWG